MEILLYQAANNILNCRASQYCITVDLFRRHFAFCCSFFRKKSDRITWEIVDLDIDMTVSVRLLGAGCLQDTVVALQALAEYAALACCNNEIQNLLITATADTGNWAHTFTITALNALVLQSVQVRQLTHLCDFVCNILY